MIKKILINWLLPLIIDLAIQGLQSLSQRSDNEIDDHIVNEIAKNQDKWLEVIKSEL